MMGPITERIVLSYACSHEPSSFPKYLHSAISSSLADKQRISEKGIGYAAHSPGVSLQDPKVIAPNFRVPHFFPCA
jgi:hypothetical protein